MDQLIPIVNKLQDVFGAIGHQPVDLPQIVVVGSQSAGKSSVLENIVGRDFLPRSHGICTRRPLVLQLYQVNIDDFTEEEAARGEEWGEFLHLPSNRFYDFGAIRKEIEKETERMSGKNKGISKIPINLKIFSPHVLNLTLVDLPGITKVPTGDQPEDVEEQIRLMCYEFISNPNAIILAVTGANQDIVNSDGLKMARSVDPEGLRTVGVLTKVDIMDQGTDCAEVLLNRVVPLKRGYVAVVNRSQKDINEDLPIRQGLIKEQKFFQSHPKYRDILTKCGTVNLSRSLNQILMLHIKESLPEIKARIVALLNSVQSNIDVLGEPADAQGISKMGGILLNLLSKYAMSVCDGVDGKGTTVGGEEMNDLYGGARLSYIFNEIFGKTMKTLDPFEGLDDDDIRIAIANANGPRSSLFVPEISFDLLVRRQISRLEQPGLECVKLSYDEMERMASQCAPMDLSRYPELKSKMFDVVKESLKDCVIPAQKMISNLIAIELAYINTSHPDFIGGKQAVAQLNKKLNNPSDVPKTAGEAAFAQQGPQTPNTPTAVNVPKEAASLTTPTPAPTGGQNNGFMGGQPQTQGGFLGIFKGREAVPPVVSTSKVPAKQAANGFPVYQGTGTGTANQPFQDSYVKLPPVPDRMRGTTTPTDRERVETEIIKSLIGSYFDIVKKNYMDLVPKAVMHFLVNKFKDGLQNELVSQLYREGIITELMRETDEVASRRKACKEMKELLQRAMEILSEVRDFNTFKTT